MTEYAGYRTVLAWLQTPPSTYTTIGQVRDISGPGVTADQVEVSHRDNTFRLYRAGMRDGGELTFDVVFDPDLASHDPTVANSLYDLLVDGTVATFRVTYPGASTATTTATFSGFVSGFEITSPMEDGLTADVTIKISGAITWAHVT